MRLLSAVTIVVAVTTPADAQRSPSFTCRETHASLKRTGNLYDAADWSTDCKGGSKQTPPQNSVLNEVCNTFTTDELSEAQTKFEMQDNQYRWSFSSIEEKPLPGGTPTTTTKSWVVSINPGDRTFSAVTQLQFVGGKYLSNEISESTGTCERTMSVQPKS